MNKKILAIIPARVGSKSIPKKNIIDLAGHPLIAYSIAAAKLSELIGRIIVSTDSEEIAEIARKYGADVPFLRPQELAHDLSLDIDFFRHALDWLEQKENYIPDLVVHLRPTTPLRDYRLVDKAISELIGDQEATSLRSAHPSDHTVYKMFKIKNDYVDFFGKEEFSDEEEYYNYARQSLPPTYVGNGYVDIIIPRVFQETGFLHGKKIKPFVTEKTADIDSLMEVELAKEMLDREEFAPLIKLLNELKNKVN